MVNIGGESKKRYDGFGLFVYDLETFSFLKKFEKLNVREWWCGATVFFVAYLFYILTLYPTVAAEDAGEFTTAVAALGIAHPSGYPLYIILGKLFTFLIPFGTFAWKVNLFSAFCGALSALFFYLCAKLFTRDDLLSLYGALLFAVGSIFWSQAIRAEVYTLNSVFFLGILFLVSLWHEKRLDFSMPESRRCLYAITFLYGLSLGNHHLMFMAGPPLFLFVFLSAPRLFKNWKFWATGFFFFLCGLAIYLYLPVRASMDPALNWGDPSNWENFWNHVMRKLYSSGGVDPSMHLQSSVRQSGPDLFSGWWFDDVARYHVWQMFWYTVKHFTENFSWMMPVFVPFGFWWLRKKSKAYFWLFTALFVFYSFVLSKLLGLGYIGKLPVDLFKDRPFYIPVLTVLCFLAVLGFHGFSQKFLKEPVRKYTCIFVGAIFVFYALTNFPILNQSQNYIAHDQAKLALTILPKDAVYIVQNGDNTLFPILYLNKVENIRNDITFYIPSPVNIYNFFTSLEDVERKNPGKRIFTDFPFVEYPGKTYTYYGPVSEIVAAQNPAAQRRILPLLEAYNVRGSDSKHLDHFHKYLQGRFVLDAAMAYGKIDDQKQGELFTLSMMIAPESANIFGQLIGNYYVRGGKFAEALPFLGTAHKFYPEDYSINFQLFLSHVLSGDPQGALPFFSTLLETKKELFLGEYQKLKILFPDGAQKFDDFEQSVEQK